MNLVFGDTQLQMSRRMQRYPLIGRIIHRLFGYTNVGNFARAGVFRRLMENLPTESFKRVMDLGCGQGEYTFMMAGALPEAQITALDVEPERLQRIAQLAEREGVPNIKTYRGALNDKPVSEAELYDFIFSVDVFEHIPEKQMPFEPAYRHLKLGGYLLVKMPSRHQRTILPERWFEDHHEWLEDEHVGQVYELEDLKKRMERAGFAIVDAFYADGLLARLGWEIGYLTRRAGAIPQLLFLPLAKFLVRLDQLNIRRRRGNTIQVIGQKIIK